MARSIESRDKCDYDCKPVITTTDMRLSPQNPTESQQFTLSDCRVRAMLDTIAWSEGTAGDADGGYGRVVKGTVTNSRHNPSDLVGQQNVTITDFSRHPDLRVQEIGKSGSGLRFAILSTLGFGSLKANTHSTLVKVL